MVNKTYILMASCLKKSKRQIVTIVILILLSSLLLNLFLYIQMDYKQNFYRTAEKLNAPDLQITYQNLLPSSAKEDVQAELDAMEDVRAYELLEGICGNGSSPIEFDGKEIDKILVLANLESIKNRSVNQFELIDYTGGRGIVISCVFKMMYNCQVGDSITFKINDESFTYPVIGFYNNIFTGAVNCFDICIFLSDDEYQKLPHENRYSLTLDIVIEENASDDGVAEEIVDRLAEKCPSLKKLTTEPLEKLGETRYIITTIFIGVMSFGSVIMTLVLLIVIAISLYNYVRNSKKEFGALKSLGYTSTELIAPVVSVLTGMAMIFSAVGAALGYLVLPVINRALESQSGIPYQIRFLPLTYLIVVLSVSSLTFLVSMIPLWKIKNILPINAIREQMQNTPKTPRSISLAKTKLDLHTAIGLKGLFSDVNRNIAVLITMIGVSFLTGFGCYIMDNIISDVPYVVSVVCGQVSDASLSVDVADEEHLIEYLRDDDDVADYYFYTKRSSTPNGLSSLFHYVVEDASCLEDGPMLYRGAFPKDDSSIAVNALYAEKNQLEIGDVISYDTPDGPVDLTICGLIQCGYLAGTDSVITRSAYERIDPLQTITYLVDVYKGVDVDAFNQAACDHLPIQAYTNEDKICASTAVLYATVLKILGIVLIALAVVIILFVLYVILSIQLKNEQRRHGILKSIGYTTINIRYHTICSIVPTSLLGIIIGLACAKDGVRILITLCFHSIGIFEFGSSLNIPMLLLAGGSLLAFTVLATFLLSRSIAKITPHALFNNE